METTGSNLPTQWTWMTCSVCNHHVAQEYGAGFNLEDLRERGWCTVCGKLGCHTMLPSWDQNAGGGPKEKRYDPDLSRESWLAHLKAKDRLRWMVIDSRTLEIVRERLPLAHAVRTMIALSGYDVLLSGSWRGANLNILRGKFDRIGHAEVLDPTMSAEQRWTTVLTKVAADDVFESRYRVITNDFYRMAIWPSRTIH